jgi:cell division protein FtsL
MATVRPSERRKRPTGERTSRTRRRPTEGTRGEPSAASNPAVRTKSNRAISRARHLKLIRGEGGRAQDPLARGVKKKPRSSNARARALRVGKVRLSKRFKAFPARRGFALAAVASLILSLFVFGLLLLHILLAQSSFQLETVRKRVAFEEERNRRMRFEVAGVTSPARVAEAARSLGLVVPKQYHYLVAPADGADDESNETAPEKRDNLKAVLSKRP